MKRWTILLSATALGLAACSPSGSEDTAAPATANIADEANAVDANVAEGNVQATVLDMSDAERNIVLVRALLDSDIQCQGVEKSERVGDVSGLPTWRATCVGGKQHLISISTDGIAHVISRTDD
mgnify:CR=1 FL=1